MKKFMRNPIAILAIIILSTVFTSSALASTNNAPRPTCPKGYTFNKKTAKCDKNKPPVTSSKGEVVRVVTLRASATGFALKFKRCLARAEKREWPAPPRDPRAKRAGNVQIHVQAKGGESGRIQIQTHVWVNIQSVGGWGAVLTSRIMRAH